jgi:Zn-dependent M28 family amino/carboxypeptidase
MRQTPLLRLFRWSLLTALLACNSAAPFSAYAEQSVATVKADPAFTVDIRQSVGYLASDELEGRGVGTPGLDKAADFVAGAFKKLGLQPVPGLEGYFQPFKITASSAPGPKTALRVGDKVYALEKDFTVIPLSTEAQFDAPVVFVGYGITSKEHDYDDYANVDVKGKVALALRYEPQDAEGKSRFSKSKEWSREAAMYTKATAAAKHGAVALLLVNPPTRGDDATIPFSVQGFEKGPIPLLHVRRHVADDMLKRAGADKDLAALQAEIDSTGKPLATPLKDVTASGQVKILRKDTPVKNVVAVLPGKGELANEFVVIGAHYDHLGRGGPGSLKPNSHEIHNGADDNASGTTAMLKLAEHYAKTGSTGRSMIFIAFTAEESGLIGSEHFVDHPPIPLDKIAYMLNLDMVGRVRNEVLSIGGSGTAPSFDAILKKADDASPLVMKSFGKGGFGPSDHMSFAMKKVPVLFFWSGNHADYHRPTDDADKVNYEGMEQVIAFATNVLDELRTHPREQYVAAADHGGMSPGTGSGSARSRVTLGVVPDYSGEEEKGVRISGTVPGSPAEKAGLKEGDVLLQFNDDKIESLYTLTDLLAAGKPGDKVKIVVLRDGKKVELEATLAERKG